jgi:putative lipoic acid-binding regulatory protein
LLSCTGPQLVDFPCVFTIKVVGLRQGEFVEDILDAIGGVIGKKGDSLTHTFRDNGKWRCVHMDLHRI